MIVGTVNDLLITSLETIHGYGVNGGELAFVMDELQNATLSNTEDVTALTGKQGRTLGQLKTNKQATVTATNGTVVTTLVAAQVGGTAEHASTWSVKKIEYLTVASNKATTTYTATGTAGDEIGTIYVRGKDGIVTKKLTQAAAAAEGKFAYAPASKEISFNANEIADGTEIMVTYKHTVEGDRVVNSGENYSGNYELFIDGFAEDKCKNIFHIQIHIDYASLSGNFDMAMGDSQTVHNFEATALASRCGTNGNLWDYTIFSDEVEGD